MTEIAPHATDTGYKPKCKELANPPEAPKLPDRGKCPQTCNCPAPPGGPPSNCLDDLIRSQSIIVKKAVRADKFVGELTELRDKVTAAQATYTQARFQDLRKTWKEQDKAIVDLIQKLVCAVRCWECLLECRLCPLLVEIRTMEDRLNGTGQLTELTKEVYSLIDLEAWHRRNVANMQARVDRINLVIAAWEKPSESLGDVLEKNGTLIEDTLAIIGTDPAKAVFDVFMTLLQRHWAIRPRDVGTDKKWASDIALRYIKICECKEVEKNCDNKEDKKDEEKKQSNAESSGKDNCKGEDPNKDKDKDKEKCDGEKPKPPKCRCDDGEPDDCCGPDVGILTLRQRLVGPLPYIVDPNLFPDIICCLTTERLSPASEQLATAQANLDATTAEIELVKSRITARMSAIEASFRAELTNPIACAEYTAKTPPKEESQTTKEAEGGGSDRKAAG